MLGLRPDGTAHSFIEGTTMRSPMVALFIFEDGGDRIVCERVYFDTESIRRQLVGDDPSV